MKISCCLITTLQEYPQIIMERLTCASFFDEILVRTESPSVYERYLLAKKAKNSTIFVQDDDCMINYQILFSHYNNQITNAMPANRIEDTSKQGITLIGWGCYFPKYMINAFDRYTAKYGEDKHLLREADRIFTYLNKPFNTIIMPHEDLPRASKPGEAMYLDPEHFPSANEAIRKCGLL
jgi:hypothetical protein